jgi:hypothetical protein
MQQELPIDLCYEIIETERAYLIFLRLLWAALKNEQKRRKQYLKTKTHLETLKGNLQSEHMQFPSLVNNQAVIVATAEVSRLEPLWINAKSDVRANRDAVLLGKKILRSLRVCLKASDISA